MSIDISEELETVENNEYLTPVLGAIARGANKIADTKDVDITDELITIETNRYGFEIRGAIHDALAKLARASSTTGGGTFISAKVYDRNAAIEDSRVNYILSVPHSYPDTFYDEMQGAAIGASVDEHYSVATVIVCVVHKKPILIDEGYILINNPENTKITKEPTVSGDDPTYQCISVYEKSVLLRDTENGYQVMVEYEDGVNDDIGVHMFVLSGDNTVTLVAEGVSTTQTYQPANQHNLRKQLYLASAMYNNPTPGVTVTGASTANFVTHVGDWITSAFDFNHNYVQPTPIFTGPQTLPSEYDAYMNYVHIEVEPF
jgi:hypothetical protein